MKLLDDENLEALFTGGPVYTKIRDDNPTRYITGCKAKNNLVADGCVIEGDVENCILFRGVKIEKGAKIRNSVLMQDTVVKAGGRLDYVVTDKNVTIEVGQELKGTDTEDHGRGQQQFSGINKRKGNYRSYGKADKTIF